MKGSRYFDLQGSVEAGEATSVQLLCLGEKKWMVQGWDETGPVARLPEPWAAAVAGFDRVGENGQVCWVMSEAAQVEALLQAVQRTRWLQLEDRPTPLGKSVGIATATSFEPVAEALSGTYSNHPFHGMWDDHYALELERWEGSQEEALRLVQHYGRGQDPPTQSESWYRRTGTSGTWTLGERPEGPGWVRVERMRG